MPDSTRRYLIALALACALFLTPQFENVSFWLMLTLTIILAGLPLWALLRACTPPRLQPQMTRGTQNLVLTSASMLIVVLCLETTLAVRDWMHHRSSASANAEIPDLAILLPGALSNAAFSRAMRRNDVTTLPDAWKRTGVEVEGAVNSYRWHDALHVHDRNSFRRMEPFPRKRAEVFRVMVVGDSLTYGYGIATELTYPAVIEAQMRATHRVEVLNLGISGHQSEDIVGVLAEFLPLLDPDLVVYGVCLNDFLPSGVGQYVSTAYALPFSNRFKNFFQERSRLVRFAATRYDGTLRAMGLRPDFMDEILQDFDGHQVRFARDAAAMIAVANETDRSTSPPMLAMVLDQFPKQGGRSHRAGVIAEKLLSQAGFQVIETSDYYRAYDGWNLGVSRWEGHPNEIANALFASLIVREVRDRSELSSYQKDVQRSRGPRKHAEPHAASSASDV